VKKKNFSRELVRLVENLNQLSADGQCEVNFTFGVRNNISTSKAVADTDHMKVVISNLHNTGNAVK